MKTVHLVYTCMLIPITVNYSSTHLSTVHRARVPAVNELREVSGSLISSQEKDQYHVHYPRSEQLLSRRPDPKNQMPKAVDTGRLI